MPSAVAAARVPRERQGDPVLRRRRGLLLRPTEPKVCGGEEETDRFRPRFGRIRFGGGGCDAAPESDTKERGFPAAATTASVVGRTQIRTISGLAAAANDWGRFGGPRIGGGPDARGHEGPAEEVRRGDGQSRQSASLDPAACWQGRSPDKAKGCPCPRHRQRRECGLRRGTRPSPRWSEGPYKEAEGSRAWQECGLRRGCTQLWPRSVSVATF
mmetsp:Transcript_50059/g.150639  ORF Transcript_50059/g.150639 Transcript_50059/m.150639 type:complete len:214 (-) Transcript_50059:772-1413(-)